MMTLTDQELQQCTIGWHEPPDEDPNVPDFVAIPPVVDAVRLEAGAADVEIDGEEMEAFFGIWPAHAVQMTKQPRPPIDLRGTQVESIPVAPDNPSMAPIAEPAAFVRIK